MNIQIETMIYPIYKDLIGMCEVEINTKKRWVPPGSSLLDKESLKENVFISLKKLGIETPHEPKLKGIISEISPKWRKELVLFSCIVDHPIGEIKYFKINEIINLEMPQVDSKLNYKFLFTEGIIWGEAHFNKFEKLVGLKLF
jgi:hypothetical protein